MTPILTATGIMAAVSLVCGVVLAFAFLKLRVEEDPRIETVAGMLPGNNCGACGSPGCKAFAEVVVLGKAKPAQCTVSNAGNISAIAAFLGVDAGSVEKRVARLHCAGGAGDVRRLAHYAGLASCRAAVLVNGGGRGCTWGCLGLADCERACTFHAITMNARGLPTVETDKCTACNDCVEVCPLELFTLEPLRQKLLVQCKSPLTGEKARAICAVACDACGRCVADGGPGVLEMRAGLPIIQQPGNTSVQATFRCPTGAIQWVNGDQFQDVVARVQPAAQPALDEGRT